MSRTLADRTIDDFGDQWSRFTGNEGWYGSLALFNDIVAPFLSDADFRGKVVVDVGSGTGRIVGMLLEAGASRVYAIEPATAAFGELRRTVDGLERKADVRCIHARGDAWHVDEPVDFVTSIGVVQFIPDPRPTMRRCFEALRPGGRIVLWLYSRENNELYLRFALPLRTVTTRLPHWALRVVVEVAYWALLVYRFASRFLPLPMKKYLARVWSPMTPHKRRLMIYDQLNPSYVKYHTRQEAEDLVRDAGFGDVRSHHRHGYSWCVVGTKPESAG